MLTYTAGISILPNQEEMEHHARHVILIITVSFASSPQENHYLRSMLKTLLAGNVS